MFSGIHCTGQIADEHQSVVHRTGAQPVARDVREIEKRDIVLVSFANNGSIDKDLLKMRALSRTGRRTWAKVANLTARDTRPSLETSRKC